MKAKAKNTKPEKKLKEVKKETPPAEAPKEEEEETPKEGGVISDGVLDAFEETAPVDPLLVDDEGTVDGDDDQDEEDLDYNPAEW